MTETVAPDFVTPPSGPRRVPVTSIVPTGRPLDEGIKLFLNQDGHGFILEKESDGLWLAPVENTTVAAARGGSTLRHKRWAEGDSHLVLSLHSPSPESMYDMFARLVEVVTGQGDYFDLVVFDPYSQEARRRTFLYDGGLENLGEVTGTYHTVGVTAKFLSPFWRGPERVVVERIAPPVKPLITADPGSPVNRWDDPEFADTVAYEPWFVVDGGLEKNGTGAEHGRFVAGHRVAVNPGETVSVSAGLSYVDGPNVGDIQVRVRAYDSNSTLVAGSTQTVISESYAGSYTGTYVVPETGAEIELGFYTASDVHANTRVRIENLDVKRDVQYLATYEWEGEPHSSPSIKRDHTGQIVARNLAINGNFSDGTNGWTVSTTSTLTTNSHFAGKMWGGLGYSSDDAPMGVATLGSQATVLNVSQVNNSFVESGYIVMAALVASERNAEVRPIFGFRTSSGGSIRNDTGTYQSANFYEGRKLVHVSQIPDNTGQLTAQINFRGASGDRLWLDHVMIAVADSESEALAQVETYFDGDTPDVVDEGSREGAYSFPFFPVFLADSTVQGEHELRVEGDAPVWPVWEIVGPGRDVEIIGPDGSRLFVEGEVSTPITIVTEPGKRSIRDASGLIWNRMKPGDDQFFALEPGEQTVKMTMVGGNPESTIKAVYSENWKTPRGTAQGMIQGGAA